MAYARLTPGTVVTWFVLLTCIATSLPAADPHKSSTTVRYLKVSAGTFAPETEIQVTQTSHGIVVTSTTRRRAQRLTVRSRFDAQNKLTGARVTLQRGPAAQSAEVRVAGRTAHVARQGKKPDKLACPVGVIVTSAPDWTDSFMAVGRYDPAGRATQKFAGLWIHPTRDPLELTFTLTRIGHDVVTRGPRDVRLDRLSLVLRAASRYVVWRNPQGQLVRLVPATKADGGIVLTGWERATRDLQPQLPPDPTTP